MNPTLHLGLKQLRVTALGGGEIVKTVTDMAGIALVFLDTCYSGDILGRDAVSPTWTAL